MVWTVLLMMLLLLRRLRVPVRCRGRLHFHHNRARGSWRGDGSWSGSSLNARSLRRRGSARFRCALGGGLRFGLRFRLQRRLRRRLRFGLRRGGRRNLRRRLRLSGLGHLLRCGSGLLDRGLHGRGLGKLSLLGWRRLLLDCRGLLHLGLVGRGLLRCSLLCGHRGNQDSTPLVGVEANECPHAQGDTGCSRGFAGLERGFPNGKELRRQGPPWHGCAWAASLGVAASLRRGHRRRGEGPRHR